MRLNLLPVMNGQKPRLDFIGPLELCSTGDGGDYIGIENGRVSGAVYFINDCVRLEAAIKAQIKTSCARCGTPLSLPYEGSIENIVKHKREATGDDDSILLDEKGELDLSELVCEHILLDMPMRYLCADECRGVCPSCGVNLNTGRCTCKKETIDPRLEVLLSLLEDIKDPPGLE